MHFYEEIWSKIKWVHADNMKRIVRLLQNVGISVLT